ncbi:hypothetical protein EHV15_04655 [Paenibacillus oralis]|uniref:DUF11 domain-containing protein n=1 Tax=Paenibacillus oralis TaxID=2490856 RepID=A0A3P3TX86_9BACL|nr:hypothetical protein [Paenibacillus oralis]RRJ62316.1 hypothetical protein EHV15_04655 [Paenibacillus oralis]
MNKTKWIAASLAVAALVGTSTVSPAYAASTTNTKQQQAAVKTLQNLKGVQLSSKSSVKLSNVNILTQDDQSVLTYTLTYYNNGTQSLSLTDYWTKVKTKKGTVYSVSVVSSDKEKKKVVPGSTLSVTYTTQIAKGLKYSDLNFQIIKWDFSASNYERSLGTISIPSGYTAATPLNSTQKLTIGDLTASAKVKSVSVLGQGNNNYIHVALNLKNTSAKTMTNPALKYYVQTQSGTPFALNPDSSSTNVEILPQEDKTLNLIAKLPSSVNTANLQLVMSVTDETAKSELPIASISLGTKKGQSSITAANAEKVLDVDSTKIATKILSVSRNQSYGESALSVQFSIKNNGDQTVKLPAYLFELQAEGKTYTLNTSNLSDITLKPNEEQIISVDGTVPVIANADKLKLVLKTPASVASSEGGNNATTGSSYPIAVYSLPNYEEMQHAVGQERVVKNNDGTFGVTLDNVQELPWSDGSILSSKITIENKGNQAAKLPDFAGAYKLDSSDLTSKVNVVSTNNTQVLGAGEKADVYVTANIPSSLKFSQLQVQLLKKVAEDKTSNWVMFSNFGKTSDMKLVADGEFFNLNTTGKKADLQTRKTYLYRGTTNDTIYTEFIMHNLEDKQANLANLTGYFRTKDGQYYKATANQPKHQVGPKSASIVTFSAQIPKNTDVANWDLVIGESVAENKFVSSAEEAATGYVNASAMELTLDSRDIKNSLMGIELFPYTLSIVNIEGHTGGSGLDVKFKYELKRDLSFEMGEFQHKFLLEVMDSSGAKFEKEIELEKDFELVTNREYTFTVNDPIFTSFRSGSFQFSVYDLYQGVKTKIATQAVGYTDTY